MTKTCTKCLLPKALSEFYAHPRTRDRLHSKCKLCHITEGTAYGKTDRAAKRIVEPG